jgi:hypothetical protein
MSGQRLTDTYDYWAQQTRQPFVADAFQRDRFIQLLCRLRFSKEAAD